MVRKINNMKTIQKIKDLKINETLILGVSVLIIILILGTLFYFYNERRVEVIRPFMKESTINNPQEETDIKLPSFGYDTGVENYPELAWYDVNLKQDKPYVYIDVVYPQFIIGNNTKKLNQYIYDSIKKELDDSLDLFNEFTPLDVETDVINESSGIDFTTRYKIMGVVDNVISISFVTTDYTGGGNGNHDWPIVINWDLKNNKLLQNDELFCSKDYLSTLKPVVRKQMLKDFEKNEQIRHPIDEEIIRYVEKGTESKDDFKFFALTKNGLMFIFPPYQILGGVFGIIETLIPYTDIPNLLCLP